jgi:hypothetical protein
MVAADQVTSRHHGRACPGHPDGGGTLLANRDRRDTPGNDVLGLVDLITTFVRYR